jgi:gas vesicle protein
MAEDNKTKQTIKGFAIGSGIAAVAGYFVGILTAPKSGKQTREDLQEAADKGRLQAEKDLKKLHTELNEVIKDAKNKGQVKGSKTQEELKTVVDKALDTKEKVKEILSALHEGGAEDEELRRAISNANNALEHLREFLKK